jgi:3-isopropylmalate/(R)-2-methylmalate dehydratase small subunit
MVIRGKVHKYGDDIDTDVIIPARYLNILDEKELGKHCLEALNPEFAKKVSTGDILVAGKNFGCGSSREQAPRAIKGCGISLVIAKSFARIFFRNAINIGLPILELEKTDRISTGDELEVDLSQGVVHNRTHGLNYKGKEFSPFILEIISAGGLLNYVQRKKKGTPCTR